MGRRINSSIYRVGKNIGWDFFYPSIYFNKGMRFQIMFGLLVTKLMFLAGLRLIKIIVNLETNKVKFFLIAVSLFKDEPMARFFTDFKAGNFPIVSFNEPRGFIKAKDTRTYDTFYNDIPGENVNEGALFSTPVSITDNFFENFAIQPLDSARRCEKEIEYATDDIKMRRIASRVFLLYYIEKLSRSRRFNAVEVTSVISDIFKTKAAEEKLHYVYTLKKILDKSKKKTALMKKFHLLTGNIAESRNTLLLKKMFILLRTLLACSKKNNPHLVGGGGVAVVPVFFGVVVLLKKKIFKSSKDFLYSFVIWLKKKKSLSILRVVKKKNFMSKVVERLGRNKLNQFLNRVDDKKIYCLFFNFFKAEISNSAPINVKAPIKLVAKKIKWFLKKVTWLGGKSLVFSRLGWKRATSLEYPFLEKKKLFEVFKKLVCFSGGLLNTEKNIIFNIGDALATNLGKSKFMPKTWAAVKVFRLNMQTQLSLIFNHNIELNLFLQNSIFSLRKPALFLLNSRRLMSRVFIKRKEKPLLKYVFFIYFLSLFFRAPQCAVNIIAEALEFSRFHYGFLGPFRKLAALLNLKEFGLLGARIGLFGRLNGRDRKFKYYVNFGNVPALRTLDLKVVYARAQSVPRYGVVHVHI